MNSLLPKIGIPAILLCALIPAVVHHGLAQSPKVPAANRTPVLVELFTSEGCSSCPPADDLLARFETEQPFNSADVVALEEHVDYFNHDGWIDPFSSADWTQRQFTYDNALHAGTPSTPQAIVEGQRQLVGNDLNSLASAIRAVSELPQTPVTLLQKPSNSPDDPQFAVTVGKLVGATEKDTPEVWLLISESGLHSAVDKGENAGHDLHHSSVVRTLKKVGVTAPASSPQAFDGSTSIKLKSGWKRENLRAVALVQEKKSRKILGAAVLPIAN